MERWLDRLHLGNCIEELDRRAGAAPAVDLVFADPPYNIGYSYDVYDDERDDASYLAWTTDWMRAAAGVLKPTGAFWIAIGDEYAADVKRIGCELGLHLRNWVVWYYTFGVHCSQKFSRSHTHLLYFLKDPKRFTFNDSEIRVPSARQAVYGDRRAHSKGRVPDNTWILRPQDAHGGFAPIDDTWYFARVAGTFKERAGFHGCQMPEQLLGRIIRCCTNEEDVVLDPFAGSGSTLIVAKKLCRRWVGYDLSPDYVRHATARLEATRGGDPLLGAEDPLASAPATRSGRVQQSQAAKESQAAQEAIDASAIREALRSSSDGYAVDRVIADPIINAAFIDACSRQSLPGRPRDWNLALLALLESGGLADIPSTRRTHYSWEQLDPFLFAAEMALSKMVHDSGLGSVDAVLCDPAAALRFDEIARSFAPGFSSLSYRWAALRLRKDAKRRRDDSAALPQSLVGSKPETIALEPACFDTLGDAPAVYLLTAEPSAGGGKKVARKRVATKKKPERARERPQLLYVGETCNAADRARRTYDCRAALDQYVPYSGNLRLDVYGTATVGGSQRRAFQSLLIGRVSPSMNYMELAAEAIDPTP